MNAKWEDFLIKGSREGYCAVCGEKTDMIDITFEVYICSVQCSRSLWEEYVNTFSNIICNGVRPFAKQKRRDKNE